MSHAPASKQQLWVGWALSVAPSLLLLMSAVMKLAKPAPVVQGFAHMGLSEALILPIGVLEVVCTVAYLIPRTAVLGAILLTGYMGGAILTHLRVGDPYWVQILVGMAVWGGLYLRDMRVRELLPLRR